MSDVLVPKACLLTCASLLERKWPTMADTLRGYADAAPLMSDIVERLRAAWNNRWGDGQPMPLLPEAADLIERQAAEIEELKQVESEGFRLYREAQAEIERLREALEWIMEQGDGHIGPFTMSPQKLSDVARAALNEHQGQPFGDPAKT